MAFILKAENLTKTYLERTAINGISFSVQKGACFGLLGPNGAGKSTTLRSIIGLTPLDGGRLEIFNQPFSLDDPSIKQRLGVVPQENDLDIDLSVWENLLVYGRYFGLKDKVLHEKIPDLLKFAQLTGREKCAVRALSGGMQRRLAIARSLIADPELVILDEPTTGLDPQARHLIWQRLRELKATKVTLILTTHYMEEAAQLCDFLVIMEEGKILASGTPQDLIKDHVAPEVIEIRGAIDQIQPRQMTNGHLEKIGDTLFCRTKEAAPMIAILQNLPGVTYLHRPANLEDVFLKLTGRELKD
ncbi:ATP-binding cassette domain-containing protein [Magnetococcales bacterium HHB-1]